jgi:hypothetical protein
LNLKEALAAVSRAVPDVLVHAAILAAGGVLVLVQFVAWLWVLRWTGWRGGAAVVALAALLLLGAWMTLLLLRRCFLLRRRAAMLFLFAGGEPSLAAAAVGHFFPSCASWAGCRRLLRGGLRALRGSEPLKAPAALGAAPTCPALMALALARGGDRETALCEALALYWRNCERTRALAPRWLGFSLAGLALLFLLLAVPNWLFFQSAGAPIVVGFVLAAAISPFLHQAFVAPLAWAGVSAALSAEAKGRAPDAGLCAKLAGLLTPRPQPS